MLRLLGFRWVFPVGTMAVPWHPALLPLVLASLVVWTVARVVALAVGTDGGVGGSVIGLSVGFVVVGMLLSVPVLAWVVLALGGRLVQALLALAAMLLVAMSVAAGEDPRWLAVLPTAYVVVWAAQAIGGRITFARLRRAAGSFVPVDVRGRAVVLPSDLESGAVRDVLVRGAAGAVWQRSWQAGDGGTGRVLVTTEQAAQLREAARNALPGDTALEEVEGGTVLSWTGALPDDAVVFDVSRRPDPAGLLGRDLWHVGVEGRSVVTGPARVVLPVPLLNAFHWVSLTSRNEWVVGFGRGRPRKIGPDRRAVHHLVADGAPVDPVVSPDTLAALDRAWHDVADRDADVEQLRAAALRGTVDRSAHERALAELRRGGAMLLGADAADVLATWLTKARDGRDQQQPATIARLLQTVPDAAIVDAGDRLVDALNSRKLALRWELTPDLDVTPLPRDMYRFGNHGGFGLALDQPELYVRVGDLVPDLRPLVAELDREMALGDDVRLALARWNGS